MAKWIYTSSFKSKWEAFSLTFIQKKKSKRKNVLAMDQWKSAYYTHGCADVYIYICICIMYVGFDIYT